VILEVVIVQTGRIQSNELADTLEGCDEASLEMYLEATI